MATRKRNTGVFRPSNPYAGGLYATGFLQAITGQGAAPAAQQYAPGAQSGGVPMGYDVNADPAVAAAHGLAEKIRARAQAQATAKRIQAAIEYGDPTGVEGLSDEQRKAAKENPFSILSDLEHKYQTGTRDLEEGLNKSNLFYSGYRGQQLAEGARSYQGARYQAGTNFRALNSDISDQLSNALLQADMYEQNALLGSDQGSYSGGDSGAGGGNPSGLYGSGLLGALRGTDPRQAGSYLMGTPTRAVAPRRRPPARPSPYEHGRG